MREDASAPLTAHVTGVTGDVTVLIVYLTLLLTDWPAGGLWREEKG